MSDTTLFSFRKDINPLDGCDNVSDHPKNELPIKIGDFLLVSVSGKKRCLTFVAQVTSVELELYSVIFLRSTGPTTYIYKDGDTSCISVHEIIKKLPTPVINSRRLVNFPEGIHSDC